MPAPTDTPRGVWITTGFFIVSGILEIATSLADGPGSLSFMRVWEVLGRGLLHFVIAAGLWRRVALCRSIAIIYCVATVLTYVVALGLAFTQTQLRFPPSVVIQSLFQVPSCVLLTPYLWSPRAAELFGRPLFGK